MWPPPPVTGTWTLEGQALQFTAFSIPGPRMWGPLKHGAKYHGGRGGPSLSAAPGRAVGQQQNKREDSLQLFLTPIHGLALNCFCPQMGRRQVVLLIGNTNFGLGAHLVECPSPLLPTHYYPDRVGNACNSIMVCMCIHFPSCTI